MISVLKQQKGFTLIELLIGFAIGILVIGVVGALFVPSLGTYRSNAAISTIQENERFSIELLRNAVDQAGFIGCDSSRPDALVNVTELPDQTAPWTIQLASPIQIRSANMNADAILGGAANQNEDINGHKRLIDTASDQTIGDILTVNYAGGASDALLLDHDTTAQEVSFRGDVVDQFDNQFILLNDCRTTSLFQIANGRLEDNDTPGKEDDFSTFSYASEHTENCDATNGDGTTLGVVLLGGSSAANCTTGSQLYANYEFTPGTRGSFLNSTSFYLAESEINQNTPSLYSISVQTSVQTTENGILLSTTELSTTELIPGVENMRARYFIRDNGSICDNGDPICYQTAQQIDELSEQNAVEALRNLVGVEISLLLRSSQGRGERGNFDRRSFTFLPVSGGAPSGTHVQCKNVAVTSTNSDDKSACPSFLDENPSQSEINQEAGYVRQVVSKTFNIRNITL